MTHLIETRELCFSYDDEENESTENKLEGKYALCGVNITIDKGEFVAVVGRNGSGKSTFAKLLNLVLEASSGEVYIDGKKVSPEMTDEELLDLRRRVGMVFQNPDNQLVATIVEEDVAFGPENLGIPSAEIRERVDAALELVGMTEYARHEPHRLSGGQKQRVAIAGIIAMMPECMIFDESTAMLDPSGRAEVVDVMEKLVREKGITVINITHLMSEAARADRIIVINEGKVIGEGTPKEIFTNTELVRRAGLELPQCAALLGELRARGVRIDGAGITPDECADIIIKKLQNREEE
ncbi:MAG: energy-coupling factor transporter ATPase [Clostridia bacterium]|nr:energy-coupling factor transporter ATPase [Clostridia bacterium]